MEVKIEVPQFSLDKGIQYKWESNFKINTKVQQGAISIVANKEGLISLANHLLNLAQSEVPVGRHLHFDEYNSLEEGSVELIIEKM